MLKLINTEGNIINKRNIKIEIQYTFNPTQFIIYDEKNHNYFLYKKRIGSMLDRYSKIRIKEINFRINNLNKKLNAVHRVKIRGIFYDDKGSTCTTYIDYLINKDQNIEPLCEKCIKESLGDEENIDGSIIFFEINYIETFFSSDHFDENNEDFYKDIKKKLFWNET